MKFARSMVLLGGLIDVVSAQVPTVTSGGVVNASSGSPTNPPGSLILIFGTNMGSKLGLSKASSTPLSTQLAIGSDKVSAKVNGIPAPVFYVVNTQCPLGICSQASVQLPWGAVAGSANATVALNGHDSQPQQITVGEFSPGMFTLTQNGVGMALAFNAVAITVNGKPTLAIAQPSGSVPGLTAVPAKAGDHLFVYATGLGPVTPKIDDGLAPCALSGCKPTDRQRTTTTQPQVLVGGVSAHIEFSGLAPQFVGVYQLQFTVPAGVSPGNAVPLQIKIGGAESDPAKVTIAVQ